jgi:PTH1 family peptidyl-tRNA hydrolase
LAGKGHVIRLYAFLGNYGREYRGNRHNVAWQFLETLPFYPKLRWERRFKGRFAVRGSQAVPAGPPDQASSTERTYFLMPETYMNLSGDSAADLMRFYQIGTGELLAVHDEIEMSFGCFGFKLGGGLGGHNGLRSLEARLGSRDFARLRFGVGRPGHDDVAGYVLSDFSPEEREALAAAVFPSAAAALRLCMEQGFEAALAAYPKVNALA